jgi:hypothetical protein
MRNTLIGTGFYSDREHRSESLRFFAYWLRNTIRVSERIVIVDNSERGEGCILTAHGVQLIRINNNLGHVGQFSTIRHRLAGWSMSWLIPAMIAYSEDMDFVYKEQDCLAFGDWLPRLRQGRAAFGKHHQLDCEQSLFWIERDYIPEFVGAYLAINEPDTTCIPERKFKLVRDRLGDSVQQHDIGPGRGRPFPADFDAQPWSAQKIHQFQELPAILAHYGLDKL